MSSSLSVNLLFACYCILSVVACSPSPYFVVVPKHFDQVSGQPIRKKLILLRSENDTKEVEALADLLNKKNWLQVESNVNHLSNAQDQLFVRSIMHLIRADYHSAQNTLARMQEKGFDCQVEILKTDCLYEMKSSGIDFQDQYQKAFDCSDNDMIKTIAKDRYRFVRYGK